MKKSKDLLFARHFKGLPDPRDYREPRHPLINIIFIALAAQLCGAEGWDAMVAFAKAKRSWLKQFLDLSRDLPSADTIRRVFEALSPRRFEECFSSWVKALSEALRGEVVAIDGKSIKGAFEEASRTTPLHLLHVWATRQRLMLAQRAVAGAPGESPAAEELLRLLVLDGAIVTADANLCTKRIAQSVLDGAGHYVLALKGNRGPLYEQVRQFWEHAQSQGFSGHDIRRVRRLSKGHGREEQRQSFAVSADVLLGASQQCWPGLRSVVMVERTRKSAEGTQQERHFYISSLPPKVKALHDHVRQHWMVENDLHWSLDVAFREDQSRIHNMRSAENLGMVRRMALQLLKRDKTEKGGLPIRRLRAGWDNDYLMHVLSS